jgi:nucleoside-diphosphate-sugar epimerase
MQTKNIKGMKNNKYALVLGGNGFIGHHLARRLMSEGYWVRVVDIKGYDFGEIDYADEVVIGDLRDPNFVSRVMFCPKQESTSSENSFDEVYTLAADMGGAGFVFTGDHDADIMHNSALINLNVAYYASSFGVKKVFYSSSACIYPQHIQGETDNPGLRESDAYPVNPDSEYGYEKIFSERVYQAYHRNYGLNIRIARFHNIFGPEGTWKGGREKAPAAICRKVAEAYTEVEIWGDGRQTRSFLYIDECIEGVRRLMESDVTEPLNIGSDEMVSINQLAAMTIQISRKELGLTYVDGPQGVRGRNSNNDLIQLHLGWKPSMKLYDGLKKTYDWIFKQVHHG